MWHCIISGFCFHDKLKGNARFRVAFLTNSLRVFYVSKELCFVFFIDL